MRNNFVLGITTYIYEKKSKYGYPEKPKMYITRLADHKNFIDWAIMNLNTPTSLAHDPPVYKPFETIERGLTSLKITVNI